MTRRGKQKVSGLWSQTDALHKKICRGLKRAKPSGLTELLGECQAVAIDTGNYIESYASEDVEALVHVLEQYCEQVYQISLSLTAPPTCQADAVEAILEDYAKKIKKGIRDLKTRTEIVFLPYKMSMWDALESVWRAAVEDARCDVYVVPIPYCDRNEDGSVKEWHYEGGVFPVDVPITDYTKYSLKEHLPDIAYIHNPYDGYNLVTSVAPDYYSTELKKYVRKLVYVPYYYEGAVLSDNHNSLPSLNNMDYIVLSSEEGVRRAAKFQPLEKLLAFGSPKVDRMLSMDGYGMIPEEWKKLSEGRKVILYNVGLLPMLQGRYRSIEKMREVFNVFKERQDVLLWWRPHPLIKASLHRAAPELVGAYEELEKEFLLERIGIYDTGADSNLAVASADAFIGDYSSMIYMFGVTGKPVFYLNQRVLADRAKHSDIAQMLDFEIDGDGNLRFVSEPHGQICRFLVKTGEMEVLGPKTVESSAWQEAAGCQDEAFVWSVAKDGQGITRQKIGTDETETFCGFPEGFYPFVSAFAGGCSAFSFWIMMKEWIYLFPGTANMILKVHRESGEIRPCDLSLPYLEGQRKGTEFTWASNYVCVKKYDEHTIAAVTAYDYSILMIDTRTDEVKRYENRLSAEDGQRYRRAPLEKAVLWGGQTPYVVCEDGLSCCLSDFLDDLGREGAWSKEKQIASFRGYTNNLDGTCGAKVHQYVMEKLEEENNAAI